MTHQPMKPPAVVKLTNQPNTVAASLETVMKAKREKSDHPCAHSAYGPPYSNRTRLTQKTTAINGRPPSVTRLKILGTWPPMERPKKTREEEYRILLPAEKARANTAVLIICGRTLIPARLMAMGEEGWI